MKLRTDFENVIQVIEETVDVQKRRNHLAYSNAHLLRRFAEDKKKILDHNLAQMEFTEKGILDVETSQMEEIAAMFYNFGDNMKKSKKSTQQTENFQVTFSQY